MSPAAQPRTPLDQFLSRITAPSDVKRELMTAHGFLNEITGWKHYEDMNLGHVIDRNVQTDLLNVAKLIKYAKENDRLDQSLDAVLLEHRVIHDLDFYVLTNGQENIKGKELFGASFALKEHHQVDEIREWIQTHIDHEE